MSPRTRRVVGVAVSCLTAVVALAYVYGGTLESGFYYDDYHFLRPPLTNELHRVWHGSWDVTGSEVAFFRPLSALLFLARFDLVGLNAAAAHALSLVGHGVAAFLVGWFLRREGFSTAGALVGGLVYLVHPSLPYSQVSWLTNQMHLAETLVVLTALLVWQGTRRAPWLFAGLAILSTAAFLLKEDGLMLMPALAALGFVRWRLEGRIDWKANLLFAAGAVIVVTALWLFRADRLGALGGYGVPELTVALDNVGRGLTSAFLIWPTRPPWRGVVAAGALIAGLSFAVVHWRRRQFGASVGLGLVALAALYPVSWITLPRPEPYPLLTVQSIAGGLWTMLLVVGAGLAWAHRSTAAARVFAYGAVLAVVFDLPFALVVKREQLHLVSLGSALAGSACLVLIAALGDRRRQLVLAGLAAVLLVPMAGLARTHASDFRACGPMVLVGDEAAGGWWVVPREIKAVLAEKPGLCEKGSAPVLTSMDQAWWGLLDPVEEDGRAVQWTEDRATAVVRSTAQRLSFELRARSAASVALGVDGVEQRQDLPPGEWTRVDLSLAPSWRAALRDGHRVDIAVTPWFVPADEDAASTDLRRHGVQIRAVSVE